MNSYIIESLTFCRISGSGILSFEECRVSGRCPIMFSPTAYFFIVSEISWGANFLSG